MATFMKDLFGFILSNQPFFVFVIFAPFSSIFVKNCHSFILEDKMKQAPFG